MKTNMRYIIVKGIKYFRSDDIAIYLNTMGDCQPTDFQRTLDEAASIFRGANIHKRNKKS